uniref:Putative secreted protein n=1 Tax=Anopheles marajoara TaxID=58244 RepID=A0A2M4CB74_9DIPT
MTRFRPPRISFVQQQQLLLLQMLLRCSLSKPCVGGGVGGLEISESCGSNEHFQDRPFRLVSKPNHQPPVGHFAWCAIAAAWCN